MPSRPDNSASNLWKKKFEFAELTSLVQKKFDLLCKESWPIAKNKYHVIEEKYRHTKIINKKYNQPTKVHNFKILITGCSRSHSRARKCSSIFQRSSLWAKFECKSTNVYNFFFQFSFLSKFFSSKSIENAFKILRETLLWTKQ